MDMNEVKTLDLTQKKKHPNELLKEIVELSFERRPGRGIHKREVESYVSNYYYSETQKEIRCTKDDLSFNDYVGYGAIAVGIAALASIVFLKSK